MIESYSFGRMKLKGHTYTTDLIICPDRIIPDWWRKSGHTLCLEDIQDALKLKPETLVVGTGAMGVLKVREDVIKHCEEQGIDLIIKNTRQAVRVYNDLAPQKRVVGAFHLTC